MFKVDIKKIIGIVVAIAAVHSIAPDWCGWLADSTFGTWLNAVYAFLNKYICLNVILATIIVLVGFGWSWHIFKDKDFRWYRPFLILLVFTILYDNNTLAFINLSSDIDYRDLTTLVGGIALLAMVYKCFDYKFLITDKLTEWYKERIEKRKRERKSSLKKEADEKEVGFSDDNILPGAVPASLQQYGRVIEDLLLGTNIKEHSFALGITGEWGSGKTTFLELLASVLSKNAETVWFNPWMCRTPEQVTDDFFASLQQQLSSRHSSLSKPIRDYAHYISNATLSWGNGFLSKMTLAFPQESLQEKKARLSDRFAKLRKPVVVLIDDLDRLERDEVFEVLRLIRNTADLKNVIYIVAYDKEYVTSVLSEKNIKDASSYMEKIFPVELHQPKVEDYQIWQTLYNELLRVKVSEGNFARQLFNHIGQNEKKLIIKILGNYRQTKRFVRLYLMNVTYIQRAFRNEIKLLDLFWMELLQMYDKRVYDTLCKDPEILLYRNTDRFILRPQITKDIYLSAEEKKKAYEGEVIWKECTPQILDELFGKLQRPINSSVCYAENFDKFFALGVSPYKVSLRELKKLLTKPGEEEKTIRQWIDSGKYYASISHQLDSVKPATLTDIQLESYLKGILYFGLVVGENGLDYGRVVKSFLEKKNFRNQQYVKARTIILKWYDDVIAQQKDLLIVSRLLKRAFVPVELDESMREVPGTPILITNEDVKSKLKATMEAYLNLHPEVNALSIFNEKSDMGSMFSNCSVLEVEGHPYEEFDRWVNVAYDVLEKHLVNQTKLPFADYRQAHQDMFMDNMPAWSDDPDAQDFYENAQENREFQMNAYFGTANGPFERYLSIFFSREEKKGVRQKKTNVEENVESKPLKKQMSKTKQLAKGIYRRNNTDIRDV